MRKAFCLLVLSLVVIRADVVECENGDRYTGKVLLVDENSVKIQNEITGLLTVPRAKVSTISFGAAKATRAAVANGPATPPVLSAVPQTNILSPTQPLKFDPKSLEQVQNQLLGDASPEATRMFQEMVRGLMSGKVDVNDVKTKAQTTLNELKDLQKDLGDDDAGALLSSYASILQNFLNQAPGNPKPEPPPTEAKPKSE